MSAVRVDKCERFDLTFGAGLKVAELVKSLKGVPQDAALDELDTTYFGDGPDGQDFPDKDHTCFVTTLTILTHHN